jgi:hypothetical protein
MGTLPTYGMAGIGIAAAIGFTFALSILAGNSSIINTSPEQSLQQKTSNVPAGQAIEDSNGAAPMSAEREGLDLGPTLESIIAMDPSTRISNQIVQDMQFELRKPVLIQTKFANHNDGLLENQSISLSIIRGSGVIESDSSETIEQRREQAANFIGHIGASSSIELDLYWNPDTTGEYTIMIFSNTAEELSSPDSIAAITIPVKVVVAS